MPCGASIVSNDLAGAPRGDATRAPAAPLRRMARRQYDYRVEREAIMTTWVVLAVIVSAVVVPWILRRRELFTVSPSEPISTMYLEMSKRRTETKAALDAANQLLR